MACQIRIMIPQSGFTIMGSEAYERSCITTASCTFSSQFCESNFNAQNTQMSLKSGPCPQRSFSKTKHRWKLAFALDTGGLPGNGGEQESVNDDGSNLGRTRLGRIVSAGGRELLKKLNSARKNFPMKIFLVLLGFYTANALATILGQTGDWDVLVAGVVVAAIEGIGMLMYRKPPSLSLGRVKSFVEMMNYWKAGVCLGLFVDAFKLGS